MHAKILVCVLLMAGALQACSTTTKSFYEGTQKSAEMECRKKPGPESQRCMDGLKKQRYGDYEKERKGS